uniref:Uncharacterized protein n=1 Tax=Arion vulgaris TaxID=1028688 RepID=A0A0B7AWV1_9EUPU
MTERSLLMKTWIEISKLPSTRHIVNPQIPLKSEVVRDNESKSSLQKSDRNAILGTMTCLNN